MPDRNGRPLDPGDRVMVVRRDRPPAIATVLDVLASNRYLIELDGRARRVVKAPGDELEFLTD